MESKRKTRKVLKVVKATPAPSESPKQHPRQQTALENPPIDRPSDKPTSAEALIVHNGNQIESLISHQGWSIIEELIDEGIASVSGRKTNGYYYSGELTRGGKNKDYLTGYQEALTQLYNRIKDFINAKNKLIQSKKQEDAEKTTPLYNPFMEEEQ